MKNTWSIPQPPSRIELIKGSIKKWQAIIDRTGEDNGHNDCPLCRRYNKFSGCNGCPVRNKTHLDGCEGTPYICWCGYQTTYGSPKPPWKAFDALSEAMARDMLQYLETILEEETNA